MLNSHFLLADSLLKGAIKGQRVVSFFESDTSTLSSFHSSFKKYLLINHYVPGTAPGFGGRTVGK